MSIYTQGGYPASLQRIVKSIPGGIMNRIYFVPVDHVVSIGAVNLLTLAVNTVVLSGETWISASMPDPNKGFHEESREGERGPYTYSRVVGTLSFFNKSNTLSLKRLRYYRFLVLVPMRDGSFRLMGSVESGARFSYKSDTGNSGKDSGKTDIVLEWESQDGAMIFEPGGVAPPPPPEPPVVPPPY